MKTSIKKIMSIILSAILVAGTITSCNDDEAISQSMVDASSKVTGFSSEQTGAGATLTINGSDLDKVERIFMGEEVVTKSNFTSQTSSALSFKVPLTVVMGVNDVIIVFAGAERAFKTIEVVALPAIGSFTPYVVSDGEMVTLVGNNFDIVTAVKVGDLEGTIVSQTKNALKFTAPTGVATNKITLVSVPGEVVSDNDLISCNTASDSVDCKVALNLNSGFEEGTGDNFDDWTKANGGTLMFATTQPGETFGGSRALKVVRDGTLASGQWRIQLFTNFVDTEIGASYTISVWAKASSNGGAFRASLNPDTGYYSADADITTEWKRFSFVVPGTRIQNAQTRFSLDLNGKETAATTFFIDDVKVIKN